MKTSDTRIVFVQKPFMQLRRYCTYELRRIETTVPNFKIMNQNVPTFTTRENESECPNFHHQRGNMFALPQANLLLHDRLHAAQLWAWHIENMVAQIKPEDRLRTVVIWPSWNTAGASPWWHRDQKRLSWPKKWTEGRLLDAALHRVVVSSSPQSRRLGSWCARPTTATVSWIRARRRCPRGPLACGLQVLHGRAARTVWSASRGSGGGRPREKATSVATPPVGRGQKQESKWRHGARGQHSQALAMNVRCWKNSLGKDAAAASGVRRTWPRPKHGGLAELYLCSVTVSLSGRETTR